MNAKRLIPIIIGVAIYIVIILLLTSYGNKKVHPDLNLAMLDAFLVKYNKGSQSIPKYQDYLFLFDTYEITGNAVIKGGIETITEGNLKMSPKEWIRKGGNWADEPELIAALRHFYDPTKPEGERYLNDMARGALMALMQTLLTTNPKTDGVEWAVKLQEHQYNWDNGKLWMKKALEEPDKTLSEKYMAGAWRALGETLHMIADNGCPSHVRNDAHPSPLWSNNSLFGDPDPYEEYMENLIDSERELLVKYMNGNPDDVLVGKLKNSKTIYELAHQLALFTNANFFTSETISGTDSYGNQIEQITRRYVPYTSPKLNNMSYTNGYYSSGVGSYTVKHCTDKSYWSNIFSKISYPYMDIETVRSQAQALLPNIVYAGVCAIDLFIPTLAVSIKSADISSISGVIIHSMTEEFQHEIIYNGEVNIIITDKDYKRKSEFKVSANKGTFEVKDLEMELGDKVFAEIFCHGFRVSSPEYTISNDPNDPGGGYNDTMLEITPNPATGKAGSPLTFNARISGSAPDYAIYKWNFGDGTGNEIIYGDSSVVHTYKFDGEYNIMLELYDNSGFITEAYSKAIITSNSNVLPSGSQSIILTVNIADFGELKYANERIEFPLLWGGNSFSVEYELPERVGYYKSSKLSIKGSLSDDGQSVASITAISEYLEKENQNGHSFINSEVRISNIPFEYLSESNEYNTYVYQLNGKEIKNKISYLNYHYYDKTWGTVIWDIQYDRDSFTYECDDCFLSSITISFSKYK